MLSLTNEENENVECVHYWIIDISSGYKSWGTCNKCGTSKQFRNTIPYNSNTVVKPSKRM